MMQDETPVPGEMAEAANPEADVPPEPIASDVGGHPAKADGTPDEASPAGFAGWLRGLFWTQDNYSQRLAELDWAISSDPEAVMNYVLRGELYNTMGEYELAIADLEWALKLASQRVASEDWGIVAQAVQDRALHGLMHAQRRLATREK